MPIFQALNTGISGMRAHNNALSVISDNVANINTVGYKRINATFQNLVADDSGPYGYAPGGAAFRNRSLNHAQGIISLTGSSTDIAISGTGFLAVRDAANSGNLFYTRAGSFQPDKNGDFRNGAGYFLQGWLLDSEGNLPSDLSTPTVQPGTGIGGLVTVNPQSITLSPVATTLIALRTNLDGTQASTAGATVTLEANLNAAQIALPSGNVGMAGNLNPLQTAYSLPYDATVSATNMASGAVTPHFSRSISVIDNTGTSRTIDIGFLKTAANTWAVEVYARPATSVTQTDGLLASGTLTFDSTGALGTVSPALSAPVSAAWNNAGGASNINFQFAAGSNFAGFTQRTGVNSFSYDATANYDPSSATLSMAGGGITPHYTSTVTVPDDAGTLRTLTLGYLKVGDNKWAVEVYGLNPGDVTAPAGRPAGQAAFGTATFNANGSLASISPSLDAPTTVGWNANAPANSVLIDWAWGDAPVRGLTQNSAAFSSIASAIVDYDPDLSVKNMASGAVPADFETPVTVVDATGVEHTLKISYLKTANNNWAVEIYGSPASDVAGTNPQIASGTLTFNGDGTLASISPSLSAALSVNWASGESNSLTFDWGNPGAQPGTVGATVIGDSSGLSQLSRDFQASFTQNGYGVSNLRSIRITDDGFVVADYENNVSRALYKVPLATFTEQNELTSISGNVFAQSTLSGSLLFIQPNRSEEGSKLVGGALENSNVETEDQLVDMITAQRAYQHNSKTVTTTDSMLQSLTQMLS